MGRKHRSVLPGLMHRSDRGNPYASNDYIDLLKASGIQMQTCYGGAKSIAAGIIFISGLLGRC
jgi:hypothetical protein